jgi:hypothetical protein
MKIVQSNAISLNGMLAREMEKKIGSRLRLE